MLNLSLPASPRIESLSSSKDLIPFSYALFVRRRQLRQSQLPVYLCNNESAIEGKKESSITLILIVFAICPSEYSAKVRTSKRCIS